ncbi:ShlB/FhaC/HecB family hemolysin secretion/activation protein [Vibrio sp. AK197]
MLKLKIVFFVSLLYWISFFVSSAPLPPSVQNEIEAQQQQRLENIKQQQNQLENLTPLPTLPDTSNEDDSTCFEINSITYSGNELFSDEALNQHIRFTPTCLGLGGINGLLRNITNYYIEHGYVTSRAYLTPQDLNSGVLNMVILEGKLQEVQLNGQPSSMLKFAFPSLAGRKLNLRDIEQGLDQINRLSRYNAQIKLLPAQQQGYSIVDIQTQDQGLVSGSFGFNNGGSESTGETQLSAAASAENGLGGLEQVSLSTGKSSEFNSSFDSENLNLSANLPFGYWTYSYQMTYSSYQSAFENNGFSIDTDGRTDVYQLGANYLFFRNSQTKATLSSNLSHRRENNYLLGTKLDSSSRNLTHFSVGMELSTRVGQGFITVMPKYSKGTTWFNALGDSGRSNGAPVSKFDKAELTLSYTYPLLPAVRYSSTLFAQWSNDTLFGNQRMSIGGEYSVRGFKSVSLSGDEGYYWRNEVNYQMGQWPVIGQVSAVLALDTGSIVPDSQDKFERGSLLGTSLGFMTRHSYYSSSVSLGFPLQSPSRLPTDDYVINYQIRFML